MAPRKKAAPAAKKTAAKKTAATPVEPVLKDPLETATPDVKQGVEKIKDAKSPELGSAAERRGDYLRALEEEHSMCSSLGKADRVKAIEAEIKRVKSGVTGRQTAPADEA